MRNYFINKTYFLKSTERILSVFKQISLLSSARVELGLIIKKSNKNVEVSLKHNVIKYKYKKF